MESVPYVIGYWARRNDLTYREVTKNVDLATLLAKHSDIVTSGCSSEDRFNEGWNASDYVMEAERMANLFQDLGELEIL